MQADARCLHVLNTSRLCTHAAGWY